MSELTFEPLHRFTAPVRVVGAADRGASDWSDELFRAAIAAEFTLSTLDVTWDRAQIGAIAASEGYAIGDEEAVYYGIPLVELQSWASAFAAAEAAANKAANIPEHCRRAGISIALGDA